MVLYKCDKCGKTFNAKGVYDRHNNRKKPCDVEGKVLPLDNDLEAKVEEISKELKKLKRENEKLRKENEKLKNVTINVNTVNNVNNVNNLNCQINLTAFGKEDLSMLTDDEIKLILISGLKGPLKYAETLHCNDEKPEFKNIYVSNHKNTNVLVFNGKTWELKDKTIIDTIRDNGIEFMEEQYEDMKDKVSPRVMKSMLRFLKHMSSDESDDIKSNMSKEIKLLLYNKRPIQQKK